MATLKELEKRIIALEAVVFPTTTTTTTKSPISTTTTTTKVPSTTTTTTTTVKSTTTTSTSTTTKYVYNTILNFKLSNQQGSGNLTATILKVNDTITLEYNNIKNWIGLPINTDIYINNILVMVITSHSDYLNKQFTITNSDNKKYTGIFIDGKINF